MRFAMNKFNQSEVSNIKNILEQPAENFGNDPQIEIAWAMKAHDHAETHFNLISSVDPTQLRLSKVDDELYNKVKSEFADLRFDIITEESIKSKEAKEKWRPFLNEFEGRIVDWNMATLLRLCCHGDVSPENTIIVPRTQWLAIEVVRNREGLNNSLRTTYARKK